MTEAEGPSTTDRLREVVNCAVRAEELGFDGISVGERHEQPFISSSPPLAPVLRREIPSRPFPQAPVQPVPAFPVSA